MSIKARRGLLLVALMVVVSALVLSVGVSSPTEAQTASVPSPAPILGKISVKATFLHTGGADAPDPPRVVDLSAAGYQPGDTLRISYEIPPSGFSYFGCQGPFERTEDVRILGVFSSSSELLAPSARARVPGAIDAGEDIYVEPTYPNNEPVDIPQDFRVTPPSGFLIEIPPSATHLFLGMADSYYIDNCGEGATFVTETAPDTTAPSLTVPSDTIVVEATGPDGAAVTFADDVSASDAVDPNPSIDCTPASGTTFGLSTTTVSCTAKDASGNQSAAQSFDVKVQDTTAPAIDAHADLTEEATGPDGATVNYTKPAANDAVDGSVDVNRIPESGSIFLLGDTTVSCTATDDAYPDLLRPGNRWPIDSCNIASASLPLSSSRFGMSGTDWLSWRASATPRRCTPWPGVKAVHRAG
jgi:hypothetical protein